MNTIYDIFADGNKVGIVVASDKEAGLTAATNALTRRTHSKMGENCDYAQVEVRPHATVAASAKVGVPAQQESGRPVNHFAHKVLFTAIPTDDGRKANATT